MKKLLLFTIFALSLYGRLSAQYYNYEWGNGHYATQTELDLL